MSKKNLLFVALLLAMIAGVFAYKSYQENNLMNEVARESPEGTQEAHSQEPAQSRDSERKELLAPGFELPDLSGNKVALEDFRGKVVLINFWTTWCPYCVVEMPEIEKTYQKYKEQGFVVLAINMTDQEENPQDPVKFMAEKKYTFPVLLDKRGEIAPLYGVSNIPTSLIVGPQGQLLDAKIGPFAPMELQTKIKGLVPGT